MCIFYISINAILVKSNILVKQKLDKIYSTVPLPDNISISKEKRKTYLTISEKYLFILVSYIL